MEFQSGAVRPIGSIEQGWSLIKDNYWMFVLMVLVMAVIYLVVAFILGLISGAITTALAAVLGIATHNSGDVARMSASVFPQIVSLVINIFTNIILFTILGVLMCGIYKGMSRVATGGAADFGDLFSEFDKIQQCLIVAVIMSVIDFVIGIIIVLIAAAIGVSAVGIMGLILKDGRPDMAVLSGVLIALLPIILISLLIGLIIRVITEFIFPLIADRNASGGEAFTLSVKAGFANFFGLAGLIIVQLLMLIAGAFACLIGMLFVAPIIFASIFAAYQSVFGRATGNYQSTPPPPPVFGNQPGY